MLKKLSTWKTKAVAGLSAFALAVMVSAPAFAQTTLESGAKTEVTKIADLVGTVGVAALAIAGAVAAVVVVMRLIKKS